MALHTDNVLELASAPNYNAAFSLTLWYKSPTPATGYSILSVLKDNLAGTDVDALDLGGSISQKVALYRKVADSYLVDQSSTTSIDTRWWFLGLTTSPNAMKLYLGDETTAVALEASGTAAPTGRSAATICRIGPWTGTGTQDSSYAYPRIWEGVELTAAEVEAERASATAVKSTGLWEAWAFATGSDLTGVNGKVWVPNGATNLTTVTGPTLPAGASAALSGTLAGATEADVVAGGKTIILTLTGETFVA